MDNDLMARRLRPPSEPPRPQNGHSSAPDTPVWAVEDSAAEVPWDRPEDEPWPPAAEETTDDSWLPHTAASTSTQVSPPATDGPADADGFESEPGSSDDQAAQTHAMERDTDPMAVAEPVAADEPEADSTETADAMAEADSTAESDSTAEAGPVAADEPEADSTAEAEPMAVAEPVAADEPASEADSIEAADSTAETEPVAVAEPVAADEPEVDSTEAVASTAETEPVAADEPEADSTEAVDSTAESDSTAVAEPVAADEPETDSTAEGIAEADSTAESGSTAVAEPDTDTDTEPAGDMQTEADPHADGESDAEAQPAPWDTDSAAIWGDQAPWDPHRSEESVDTATAVADPSASDGPSEDSNPAESEVQSESEAALGETDMSVPGRPAWDAPSSEWDDEHDMDDRPSEMLGEMDDMVPVVSERVAAAQAAAATSETPSESEDSAEPAMQTVSDPTADLWAAAESDPAPWAGTAMPDMDPDAVAPWETDAQAAEADSEAHPGAVAEAESEGEPEVVAEAESEAQPETVAAAESEAEPEAVAQDPYDADAPVLADVEPMTAPTWDDWSPTGVSAVAPLAVAGRQLSPTPPDGLFDQSAHAWSEADFEPFAAVASDATDVDSEPDETGTAEVVDSPETSSDTSSMSEPVHSQAVPATQSLIIATGPGGEQQLVLRIELAIVDPTNRLRPADEARRVGPWSDDEPLTPRHPEFEPRTHPPFVAQTDDDATVDKPDDPWALPPLAEQNPTGSWVLDSPAHDPLASLPAATFAPATPVQPTTVLADQPFVPVVGPKAAPAKPTPAAQAQPSHSVTSTPAAPAVATATLASASTDQSDLWFLASEPTVEPTGAAQAATAPQSSSLLTVGATLAAAAAVIVLVLVFLFMMTSLLH